MLYHRMQTTWENFSKKKVDNLSGYLNHWQWRICFRDTLWTAGVWRWENRVRLIFVWFSPWLPPIASFRFEMEFFIGRDRVLESRLVLHRQSKMRVNHPLNSIGRLNQLFISFEMTHRLLVLQVWRFFSSSFSKFEQNAWHEIENHVLSPT